jgi:hypothetical protein
MRRRALLLLSMAVSMIVVPVAVAIDGSALQKGKNGFWHLVMPSELTAALRDSVPDFRIAPDSAYGKALRGRYPYKEHAAPFALIADLNGDTREDVVFDGSEGEDRVVYLALSRARSWRFVEVMRLVGRGGAARDSALFWADPHPLFTLAAYPRTKLGTFYAWTGTELAVLVTSTKKPD